MAYELTQLIGQPWMFGKPNKRWLLAARGSPEWDGVVIKRAASPYIILGSDKQTSLAWFKRTWA